MPSKVEVWELTLPHLNDSSAFNTAFNFNSNMSRWYPGNPWAPLGLRLSEFAVLSLCVGLSEGTSPETWWGDWLPFLAHHRVPGDSIYLGGPRPVKEYEALAASGAKWMGMVSTPACERLFAGLGVGCHTDGAVFQGDAGISFRPPANGTVPDGYVDGWIERLKPAMGNLSALGLLDKTYVCASKVDPKHRDSKALAADPQGVACRWL